ncbi:MULTISPECIES: hypothetical protein [Bacillus]|uniref:hypothetical protein n=1 Tax=Bacillus TaxID=1386 RepID=UPI0008FE2266|nr:MULTISPECIES: hypothetical protein [Bacillus]OJE32409.1 hypothetical protein BAQ44_22225 [Bacillus mobilis]HDR7243167.1 hypothetical protein [Bacillus mobilis]HDR7244986.1 hypothetical protein [Bacillus mobilis]
MFELTSINVVKGGLYKDYKELIFSKENNPLAGQYWFLVDTNDKVVQIKEPIKDRMEENVVERLKKSWKLQSLFVKKEEVPGLKLFGNTEEGNIKEEPRRRLFDWVNIIERGGRNGSKGKTKT